MAKVKLGKWEYTEEELEEQFAEATRRGEEADRTEPRAENAYYDRASERLVINLKNGSSFSFPPALVQGLADAASDDVAEVELTPRGTALHWEKLDVDFSVPGLMARVFGTRAWMSQLGRIGGSATSEAKATAARANGLKGGRPAKTQSSYATAHAYAKKGGAVQRSPAGTSKAKGASKAVKSEEKKMK